jgi:hypothetical protein
MTKPFDEAQNYFGPRQAYTTEYVLQVRYTY